MRAREDVWCGATARLVKTPLTASVTSIVPGPSHSWLAGDDEGGLWCIHGASSQRFHLHRGTVNAVACIPSLARAVSGADDESVHHWAWHEGSSAPLSLTHHTMHKSYVTDVAIRHDELLVASIGLDLRLVLSSPSQDTPALIVRLPAPAVSVTFFPSPLPLLLLASSNSVSLCDLRMPKQPLLQMSRASSLERIWRTESTPSEEDIDVCGGAKFGVLSNMKVSKDSLTKADKEEKYDRFTERYVAPLEPHVASPLLGASLATGALAFLSLSADAHLCMWRTDDGSLLASDRLAPASTPRVRASVASHAIATCHGAHVSIRTERAPHLSSPVELAMPVTRFPITALSLRAPEGPLMVGNAGGQFWLFEPHFNVGDQ